MPRGRLHQQQEPAARDAWPASGLRRLPLHCQLARCQVRPCALCALSPYRQACRSGMRLMPRQQQLQFDADGLLLVPQSKLHRDNKPAARLLRLPNRLLHVSHHQRMDSFIFQAHDVSAHGCSRDCLLRLMPHRQQLQDHPDRLLLLPQVQLRFDDESQSRERRLPHNLRHLPHHDLMDWCGV